MGEPPRRKPPGFPPADGVDARDGLTRLERIILWQLHEAEREAGDGRRISTALLYGRVVEHIDVSVDDFQAVLQKLVGRGDPDP